MSKSTVQQTLDGTFRIEEVSEIPERLRFRGSWGKWRWLRDVVTSLRPERGALRIECPNRATMIKIQAAAQNCNHGKSKNQVSLSEEYKAITRSEPAPGLQNGTYHLYIEVIERKEYESQFQRRSPVQ